MSIQIYNQSLALLTDLYQITMAYAFWKNGLQNKEAVFHLFFRRRTFKGGFTIAAGLEAAIQYLENFRFSDDDLRYLSSLTGEDGTPLFEAPFFDYLATMKFTGEVDAVPEGTVVFPYEPLLRVQGPLIQCQILESPLLNSINFPTLIATKAARTRLAAKGDLLMEFGLRRAQGIDGALTASRAAYIGGCDSTSNVLAGKLFGIPVRGTHSHSWVMAFEDEQQSFQAFAEALPNNSIFLVDTYDTIEGVKKAIEVGKWLKERGKKMVGIRLDSGDLSYLSIKSRQMLDEAGFKDALICASNELDENVISELKKQGSQITLWGVGTHLVTGKEQPALDGVYKLSAIRDNGAEWQYKLKLSEQMLKVSNPGILQVKRFYNQKENLADMIYDIHTGTKGDCVLVDPLDPTRQKFLRKGVPAKDLLIPIFREGKRVYQSPPLKEIRENTKKELAHFNEGIKRFLNPHQYSVGMEQSLYNLKIELIKKIRSQSADTHILSEEENA